MRRTGKQAGISAKPNSHNRLQCRRDECGAAFLYRDKNEPPEFACAEMMPPIGMLLPLLDVPLIMRGEAVTILGTEMILRTALVIVLMIAIVRAPISILSSAAIVSGSVLRQSGTSEDGQRGPSHDCGQILLYFHRQPMGRLHLAARSAQRHDMTGAVCSQAEHGEAKTIVNQTWGSWLTSRSRGY